MPRRFQFSVGFVLLLITCCALALGLIGNTAWRQAELWRLQSENTDLRAQLNKSGPTDAVIREWPMTIAMSTWGDFAQGSSWHLSVNSAGQAQLTISHPEATQEFQISKAQLDELRELLIREEFFELNENYGQRVPDGSTQTLSIVVGDDVKTVHIHFLMNWANDEPERLREPARALRVWKLIRSWFQHPNAVDLEKYNQSELDAVDKLDNPPATNPPHAP